MPYCISIENNVLQITLNGHVTGNDLQKIVAETAQFERAPIIPHRVTDLSEITNLDVSFPDVMTIAQQRRVLRFQNSFKSAIIAHDDLHLGYARMFQTLNDNPQIYIRIFADRQAADRWVLSDEQTN
jgi:hypothetical protein